ncbi:DNA topoisomerase I [Methanohalophilus euhalobius]|jgi:DNA topoisomerase-1|uniref:DNA topoisomerase 1 n=1 Tax=Methanohalophilus euhalobius TaxID=51203 RepID=A0A314ZZ10_9EURY|nr:DNA topoisomerase I [Methanohalophilus euhalobius]PQV43406.1 DNA topoisomerase I [Methanohalophilus euhalobius]RNI07537.1 DNA topoisomerase I [Methanohalophilus euhalobius]RSD35345.1 MAG: DNA topoisomerase I [Methanohalophilus sp.]
MHLIIAEKQIAARRIASILSPKKPQKKRISGIDSYEFGNNEKTIVIGLSGHIVQLDFPPAYNNWQKVEAKELVDAELIITPTHAKIVSALKKLGKKATKVTIATDYDREGELIGVEALNIVKGVNENIEYERAVYSAITPAAIKEAFENTTKIDFNLADAGHSRQVIDLVWGASLTRFISLASRRLGKQFLSVGRVQSPTLALIVDREKEREVFVPAPYWEIYVDLVKNGENFKIRHKKTRFWEKEEADRVFGVIGDEALVSSLETSTKEDKTPMPFNTTEFIRAANSIGFTPANAMRIAESLYTNGYISYPRTDNTVYPSTIDLREQIEMFSKGHFSEYAKKLLAKKELKPTKGKKETTDHPPIFPASVAKKSQLKEDEWKVYELVVRRFFATFAENAEWETMKVSFDINEEEFRANGSRLVKPGWRWYYPYNAPEDRLFPALEEGEILPVNDKEMLDKETNPPGRYGQGRLIKMMEDMALGTKATRHEIISKLYSRAYVHGNPLQPTQTAYAVVEGLENYAPTITRPDMTSTLEEDMDRIAEGNISEEKVLQQSRDMLKDVFKELEENREKISESLREGLRKDKIIGKCPDCGCDLIVRRSRRGSRFIGCEGYPDCTFSLPLPKSGHILVTDKTCDKHSLYHIKVKGQKKRAWDLGCPYCNYLEWKEEQKKEKAATPRPEKISDIPGIGKVTEEKLNSAGISTVDELENSDANEISKTTNIPLGKIIRWQEAVAY